MAAIGHYPAMQHKPPIHFVDPHSRNRAALANAAFAIGHHAEVYSDVEELCERQLPFGFIVAHDDAACGGIGVVMQTLSKRDIWLPVIAIAEEIETHRIVAAMKAGALDYLALPLETKLLSRTLEAIGPEAREYAAARQTMYEARKRVSNLSAREREVLDRLSFGASNKEIARDLEISPRTVEIHRANMMTKMGASHSAEAVRMRIEADLG